jgi:ribosome-associated protein
VKTLTAPAEGLRDLVINALNDRKANQIKVINVATLTEITDYMVIASGGSLRHMRSLVDQILYSAKGEGINVLGVEGLPHGDWILVDLGEVVVHLMKPEARAFYELERLWEGISDPHA